MKNIKKKLILFILPILLLSFGSRVEAETDDTNTPIDIYLTYFPTSVDYYVKEDYPTFLKNTKYYKDTYTELYSKYMKLYNDKYKKDYPYYVISIGYGRDLNCAPNHLAQPLLCDSDNIFEEFSFKITFLKAIPLKFNGSLPAGTNIQIYHDYRNGALDYSSNMDNQTFGLFQNTGLRLRYYEYYDSNFDLPYGYNYQTNFYTYFDDINNSTLIYSLKNSSDIFPKANDVDNNNIFSLDKLTKVNLNDYNYVVLVPKFSKFEDYYNTSNKNKLLTNFYFQGSYCHTVVPFYGTTESMDTTNQAEGCQYSETLSNVGFELKRGEILNHDVYYFLPDQKHTDIDNIIYFDPDYFDIVYNTDSSVCPVITVDGVNYNSLCYQDIKYTAQTWQDEDHNANLLDKWLASIKKVFIPSDEYFTAWFSEMHTFFSKKLGVLFYPFDFLSNLLNRYINLSNGSGVIDIPEIKFPLSDVVFLKATTFNLSTVSNNSNFAYIYNLYLDIVDVILIIALIVLSYRKFSDIVKDRSEAS